VGATFDELVAVADDLDLALRVHRAVAIALGDRINLRTSFAERVDQAVDALLAERPALERLLDGPPPERADRERTDLPRRTAGVAADLARHLAALLEWRATVHHHADAQLARNVMAAARVLYGSLGDNFGATRDSFLRARLCRVTGCRDEAFDDLRRAREVIEGSGFDYARGKIVAEEALLSSVDHQEHALDALGRAAIELAATPREVAHVLATRGLLEYRAGDFSAAASRFATVRSMLLPEHYDVAFRAADGSATVLRSLPGAVEWHLDVAINEYRLSHAWRASEQPDRAVEAAILAATALQHVPVGWHVPDVTRRDDPFHDGFLTIREHALETLADCGVSNQHAVEAATLAEAIRRSSMAGLLRRAVIDRSGAESTSEGVAAIRAAVGQRLDRVVDGVLDGALEQQQVPREVLVGELDESSDHVERDIARAFSGSDLDAWLAEACFPSAVDVDEVRRRVATANDRGDDVLLVMETRTNGDGVAGVAIHFAVNGAVGTKPVRIVVADAERIRSLHEPGSEFGREAANGFWNDFGLAVLPGALRDREGEGRVLVSPSGFFTLVPWAAVGIGGSRRLVQRDQVAIVPSLTLIAQPRDDDRVGFVAGAVRYSDDAAANREGDKLKALWERQKNPAVSWTDVWRPSDVADLTRTAGSTRGLMLLGHGAPGTGLEQHLRLDSGAEFTTFDAFGCDWPSIVVMLSCYVSSTPSDAGIEPFSIAIACLAAGATEFAAGVHPVALGNEELNEELVKRLARGETAVEAVWGAQRAVLDRPRVGSPALFRWAGLQVMVSA
jgi:hypothetical protein